MMIGRIVGSYRVTGSLGQGGMGEVYRAADSKLGREVALKVLPAAFSSDADRMARFGREAHVLASLNHPNIASIYGLEESDGIRALVMELVEGPTLADRIAQDRIPLEEALGIARQIAEALEYAHEKGVVHRDLKPANVKITPDGLVKVLDFGLAKAADAGTVSGDVQASPTLTIRATQAGIIMGTASYMSPEQASGRPADKRADIWSFGVVLWEMLTGRRLFAGETISHTLADVLRADIDVNKMPASTPPAIRDLVRRCLERDVKNRLRDIGEARILIQKYQANPAASELQAEAASHARAISPGRRILPWATAALGLMLVALAVIHFRESPAETSTIRFTIPLPEKAAFRSYDLPAISPDGRNLVFTAVRDNSAVLWLRSLDAVEPRPIPGTEGAFFPFWSPDGKSVAFFGGGKLKKVDLLGGPPITLCDVSGVYNGGTWDRDRGIVFATSTGSLKRVPAAGGDPRELIPLDKELAETAQIWPHFLPGGKNLIYWSRSSKAGNSGIRAVAFDGGASKSILNAESKVDYVPPGYLLFTRQAILMAQPFDAAKLATTGEAFPVAEGIGQMQELSGMLFSASVNGVLAYRSSNSTGRQIVTYNRDGKLLGKIGEPGTFRQLALSPDEKRLVLERMDAKAGTWDIWILELSSGILSRLTFDPANDSDPVWSPDSRQVAFNSDRAGNFNLYRKTLGSSAEELLFKVPGKSVPEYWLKNDTILFGDGGGRKYSSLPLSGERKPAPLFQSEFIMDEPHVSPDQRWVAYNSNESGRFEVYVAAYPSFGDRRQVSNNGGVQAHWRRDEKELIYLAADGKMMSVDLRIQGSIDTGVPKPLFETRLRPTGFQEQYAVSGDGTRFFLTEALEERDKPMTVILNWTSRK